LNIWGNDFKKEFAPILKEPYKDKFEEKFLVFKKKYENNLENDGRRKA